MDIVERMARAICRVDLIDIAMEDGITLVPNGLDASVDKEWRNAVPNALAALDSITTATDHMMVEGGLKLEAMMFEDDPEYTGVIFKDCAVIYRTMLKAGRWEFTK